MKENSKISALIVSYYTTDILFDSINSCLNMNGIKEVIVVNNGNTPEIVEKLVSMNQKFEIKLIDGQGNVGFSKGCNIAVKNATGEYLLFINPDCYTDDKDFAIKLQNAIERNNKYWFATAFIMNSDGSIQKTCRRNLMTPLNAISESLGLRIINIPQINLDIKEIENLPEISPVPAFSGALFFCSKEKYIKVGMLSEEYFLHVEDMDLCKKISIIGGKICFVKSAKIYHKLSTSQTTSKFLEYHKAKGFILYLSKYFKCCRFPILNQLIKFAIWTRYYIKTLVL